MFYCQSAAALLWPLPMFLDLLHMCEGSLINQISTNKSLALHYISLKENVVGSGGENKGKRKTTTLDFPPKAQLSGNGLGNI